ncbi:MAG: hypothetical protein IAF08_10005, partial [Rhizobacter sp.]|nr:hypothetical protein [Chlorobiales bacterium]
MNKVLFAFGCMTMLCCVAIAQEKSVDNFFLGTLGNAAIRLRINRALTSGEYTYTQIGKDLWLEGK